MAPSKIFWIGPVGLPTSSTSSADVSSLVIAAPVDGFQITGDIGCQVEPRVAPVHPGRGEFAPRYPSCRSGLCDPLLCICKCSHGSVVERRVRFDTKVEVQEFVPIDEPTVHIGPCGERRAVDPSDPLAPKRVRYQHAPDVRHAARINFMKFHRRDDFDGVCEDEIEESSLGISGWAFAHVPNQATLESR